MTSLAARVIEVEWNENVGKDSILLSMGTFTMEGIGHSQRLEKGNPQRNEHPGESKSAGCLESPPWVRFAARGTGVVAFRMGGRLA